MALALLTFEGCDETTCRFRADIGTNHLYRYVIGRQKSLRQSLEQVDEVSYESPMAEAPAANPLRPEFELLIPAAQFTGDDGRWARFVQLHSYADEAGRAEALSDVLTVETLFQLPNVPRLPLHPQSLTAMQTPCGCQQTATYPARSVAATYLPPSYAAGSGYVSPTHDGVRQVACSYRAAPVSRAMFWEALLEAAKLLVPAVMGAVGAGSTGAAPSEQTILQTITQILNALAPATPATPAVIPAAATPVVPAAPAVPAATTPAVAAVRAASLAATQVRRVRAGQPVVSSYGMPVLPSGRVQTTTRPERPARYGSAMFIDGGVLTGPLLASLLGPVLQQAPQLLQTVLDSPLKLFNAITARKLGQQQLEQNYLTGLLATISQRDLMNQLAASGLLTPPPTPALSMSAAPSRSLTVSFALQNPLTVAGKPRFVFVANQIVTLTLNLTATGAVPAVFPKLIVQLQLKDSRSLQVLVEKRYQLKDVPTNGLLPLSLLPDELEAVPRNEDVLVEASLVWQTQNGTRRVGTYSNQFIYLADGFVLDRVGAELAAPIPLNNATTHRVFWHKIWEGGGDGRRWELALTSKYLYLYAPNADTNGRMETKLQLTDEATNDADRLTLAGKLKTGLEVSPVLLNELLPTLGAYPSLSAGQLAALRTDDLDATMNQEATTRLELKGKRDERGVVWVYPEIVVHTVTLARLTNIDANGQATQTQPETVAFPRISSAHFVGAKTEPHGY